MRGKMKLKQTHVFPVYCMLLLSTSVEDVVHLKHLLIMEHLRVLEMLESSK